MSQKIVYVCDGCKREASYETFVKNNWHSWADGSIQLHYCNKCRSKP